jgi:hypothetical protein
MPNRINLGGVWLTPYAGGALPPFSPGVFSYDYLLAQNGLFVRGQRDGLEAIFPVAGRVRGRLGALAPTFCWNYPLVPAPLMSEILAACAAARDEQGRLIERLFYLRCHPLAGWSIQLPEQTATRTSVSPGPSAQDGFGEVLIELHSHGALPPFFSQTDNASEGLLRLYAVLGRVDAQPTLRVRVGVYSYWWELPAEAVFALGGTEVAAAPLKEEVWWP